MKGAMMSVSDKLLQRKRVIIDTINDELKNNDHLEHSWHRCFDNFMVNLLGALAAHCYFPKKPIANPLTIDMSAESQWVCLLYFQSYQYE